MSSSLLPIILDPSEEKELQAVYVAFASFGSSEIVEEMDSAHFYKLCRVSAYTTS